MDVYELKARHFTAAYEGLLNDSSSLVAQAAGSDGWSRTEHFLAMIVDELRLANWQRTKEGAKNRNRPKRISPLAKPEGIRIGKTDLPPEEVIEFFDKIHRRGKYAEVA